MFHFHGHVSDYDQDDVYICAIRDDYDVGDTIDRGSFKYKIVDIDRVNQLMMMVKHEDGTQLALNFGYRINNGKQEKKI